MDDRIQKYIQATHQLKAGNFHVDLPVNPPDEVGQLGKALQDLAISLETRYQELQQLNQITTRINSGLMLDQILSGVYNDFRPFIPYDRIGVALLEGGGSILRARWARNESRELKLGAGYSARMEGSSLQAILDTRQPRILNDLAQYLADHPSSESTRLIVEEGYKSSLTCPLVASGVPVGFIFFTSLEIGTYHQVHIDLFQRIAEQLSVIVEKGRLVSELAEKGEKIESQNEELRRLSYLKNVFLGMAVHDLRNPISNIQLVSDVMLSPSSPPLTAKEKQEFLNDINQQSRYMALLINDILNVAEIEAGQLKLVLIEVDLGEFLIETARRHDKLAKAKGTHVLLEAVPQALLRADIQRLRQVVDNLISNAVKYSPSGTTVRLRSISLDGAWRIEVQDEGPGITDKDRSRLFQDFSRLSARPTGGEKSTGLGLAIARRVVEAHGGQIGVDSVPGKGATFWFTIPAD